MDRRQFLKTSGLSLAAAGIGAMTGRCCAAQAGADQDRPAGATDRRGGRGGTEMVEGYAVLVGAGRE